MAGCEAPRVGEEGTRRERGRGGHEVRRRVGDGDGRRGDGG